MKPKSIIRSGIRALYLCVFLAGIVAHVYAASSVEIVEIPHSGLNRELPALVVLPKTYSQNEQRFPAIYLLHGYGGNHATFSRVCNLKEYADSFDIILVCPDGNYNSWYLDSPVKKKSQFASYIIHDVVPFIDRHFRTIADASGRAIVGSSMGGHGALTLLARYPDHFNGAGSISGILDITVFPHEWDMARILGSYTRNITTWQRHSFFYMLKSLVGKEKAIIIDCGTSDFALSVNRAAHAKMKKLGIDHAYFERPGWHSYKYVQKVLGQHLAFLAARLRKE